MAIGVKCPKCGLMQLAKENCESCGRKLDSPKGPLFSRSTSTPSPDFILPTLQDTAQTPTPQGKKNIGPRPRLSFHGTGGALFGIFLLNTLLTILTLGLYSFWGKVKTRSYIWSKTEFEGDGLAYHGTGKELLVGFLKALLVFGIPVALLNTLPRMIGPNAFLKFIPVLTYSIISVFVPVAMVGARRYRLSRTSWRGIFFSFRGHTWEFVRLFLRGSFLSILTLGFYYPIFATRRHGFMVSHSYFGNQKFKFDGKGRDLVKPYFLALLLSIPTLGICWFWFLAKKQCYFWEHTYFEATRFHSTVTGRRLLALNLGNLFLLILTLGLAWPWVLVRKIRFTLTYLTLEGLLDPATIRQDARDATATGEVLAGFMDAGFDLG
ncbi:MAG: DUF898 family protein [Thermodesulfobacteriota bacterium]|jgi:uncharacterized membrane protein YjgN (DUF898 family)